MQATIYINQNGITAHEVGSGNPLIFFPGSDPAHKQVSSIAEAIDYLEGSGYKVSVCNHLFSGRIGDNFKPARYHGAGGAGRGMSLEPTHAPQG